MPRKTSQQRFWAKVNRNGPMPDPVHGLTTNCWLWTGATNLGGYGLFSLDGAHMKAHRASYMLFVGQIPPGQFVDHRCHRRNCIRPDHLRPVTRSQNTQNVLKYRNNKSGVKGVYYEQETGKYRVIIRKGGVNYQGGRWSNLADAELAAVNLRNRIFTHNDADKIRYKA